VSGAACAGPEPPWYAAGLPEATQLIRETAASDPNGKVRAAARELIDNNDYENKKI
jgi:hypothetical protein